MILNSLKPEKKVKMLETARGEKKKIFYTQQNKHKNDNRVQLEKK